MSFTVVAIAGTALGAAKMIKGGIDKSRARKRQNAAKEQLEAQNAEKLAEEVQSSKWVLEHGGLDKIVPRKELRSEVYNFLSILLKIKEKEINNTDDVISIDKSLQKTPKAV